MSTKEAPKGFNLSESGQTIVSSQGRRSILDAPIFHPGFWGKHPQDIPVAIGAGVGFVLGLIYSNYYIGGTIGAALGLGVALAVEKTITLVRRS